MRLIPVLVTALCLAACKTTVPVAPPTARATTTPSRPGQPTSVPTNEPVPTPGSTATPEPAPTATPNPTAIQLIGASQAGATFQTLPGSNLTLVASAAAEGTSRAPLRFSVMPTAFNLLSLPQAAPDPVDAMPYSAAFTQNREGLGQAQPRHLLQTGTERALGSTEKFWINRGNSSADSDVQQTCKLVRITPNGYFFIDLAAKAIPDANLDKLATEWETRIYPRVTGAFGSEAKPGIDSEDRVFIVLSPAVDDFGKDSGLMGYFWSRDAIPGYTSHSNQKEVLFMTDQLFNRPELTAFGTLAHEFQHLVNFSQKAARLNYRLAEETWLDEGLSMYAMEVAGYGLPQGDYHIAKDLRAFMEKPADYTLTGWDSNPNGFAYGQSYLFVRYLANRYGDGILKEILSADSAGVKCVEDVLHAHGTSFTDNFRAWAITNKVTGAPVANGTPYNYEGLSLVGTYKSATGGEDVVLRGFQTEPAPGTDVSIALKAWGTAYFNYEAAEPKVWKLKLGESSANRLIGATIVP